MIFPDVPAKQWAEQHKILLDAIKCPTCPNYLSFTKPIAMKGYRGLATERCSECGEDSGIFRVVPTASDTKSIWNFLNPWSDK